MAFHDLDVRVAPKRRERALAELHRLGYSVVAFTTVFTNVARIEDEACPAAKSWVWHPPANGSKPKRPITVLERAHFDVCSPSQLVVLQSPNIGKFDLVSVMPASESLVQACVHAEPDIITLEPHLRGLSSVKRLAANVAAEKGISFEFHYAELLRARDAKRTFLSNSAKFFAVTRGRRVIISSGARKLHEFRGALDVLNLASMLWFTRAGARDAIEASPKFAVSRADVRVNTVKGIVRVLGEMRASDYYVGGQHMQWGDDNADEERMPMDHDNADEERMPTGDDNAGEERMPTGDDNAGEERIATSEYSTDEELMQMVDDNADNDGMQTGD